MNKRNLIAVVAAAAMVLMLTLTSGAVVKPKLTLSLHHVKHHSNVLKAKGNYDPNTSSSKCKAGGRFVSVKFHKVHKKGGVLAGTTTQKDGDYSVKSGQLSKGTWTANAEVQGDMSGPYGNNVVCKDADAKSSNTIKIGS